MHKFYTAFTKEIDNPEAAVRDITEQLKPEENMLKNTVGIVHFYYEFAETGVCRAIADALPFELVGCVSSYSATNGGYGDIFLSVTMLTSDQAEFSVKILEDMDAKPREHISREITRLFEELCLEKNPKSCGL